MSQTELLPEPIERLKKDVRAAAKLLTIDEIRYLVDLYYQIQEFRKGAGNQISTMTKSKEPVFLLSWSHGTMERIEEEIRKALDIYTDVEPTGMGAWTKAICGIGPVISAGLLAHIEMEHWRCRGTGSSKREEQQPDPADSYLTITVQVKVPCAKGQPCSAACELEAIDTVGHIWSFAGLDPTRKWNKGEKRPWCADLKVLCWKIGQSFMKVQNNDKDVYGKLYARRKALEIQRNESGQFKETAAEILKSKNFRTTTEAFKAYSLGKLPPGHIDARARRYAVKQFLADWHGEAYRRYFKKEPPLPYPIAILGHSHYRIPGTTEIVTLNPGASVS